MKMLFTSVLAMMVTTYCFAQINNAGFENWTTYTSGFTTYEDPDNWSTPNSYSAQFGLPISVTKDAVNPHTGAFAVSIESKFVSLISATLPSMVTNGNIAVDIVNQTFDISGGQPVTGRPLSFDGWMRYDPQAVADSAFIMILLTRYDVAGNSRDTVGIGYRSYGGSISSWTPFSVPVQYLGCQNPDSVLLIMASGNPFTMQATDGTELVIDDVSFTLGTGNSAPIALPDFAVTNLNTAVLIDVQNNDCDPDGDPITTTLLMQPANGTAVVQGADVLYTPDNGFSGQDIFTYRVCDNNLLCDSTLVVVDVVPNNSAPTAVDDVTSTGQGFGVVIDVQANDNDPDGDPLITTIVNDPANGITTVLNGDSVLYQPDPGFNGSDNFTYQICDNGTPALCDQAQVTISVNVGVNDLPSVVTALFPNPASDRLQVHASGIEHGEIRIFSVTGELMLVANWNSHSATIDVSSLENGFYTIEIAGNEQVGRASLLIQR
jgi:hypothetical protein